MCVVLVWWSVLVYIFFFKQKTAYEMRISDWSSDVCSSDLLFVEHRRRRPLEAVEYHHQFGLPAFAEPVPQAVAAAHLVHFLQRRSEERRVGKECVSPCRYRWSPYHKKKKKQYSHKS